MFGIIATVSLFAGAFWYLRLLSQGSDLTLTEGIQQTAEPILLQPENSGWRNNNPGNIRAGVGFVGEIGADARGYAIFDTLFHGIRAAYKDLTKDYKVDGQRTIRSLISEWAPSNENDTNSYIAFVVGRFNRPPLIGGVSADSELAYNRGTLYLLMSAIFRMEQGKEMPAQNIYDVLDSEGVPA